MQVIRLVVGALFSLTFLGSMLCNVSIPLRFLVRKQRGSMMPLVGGTSGMLALLCLPVEALHQWWWVPLVVDPGCALMLVGVVFKIALGSRGSED